MRLKPSPIEIPSSDPFKFDALGRKPAVEFLSNIIENVDAPFVLCLNSPWGTGKTTFINMWLANLKAPSIHSLYFNSWTTDFANDPLVAFVSEVVQLVKDKRIELSSPELAVIERAKTLGSMLARRALPLVARVATAGVINVDETQKALLAEFVGDSIHDVTDAYLAEKDLIQQFHDALCELVALLSTQGESCRLLIVVDELDRCRPTYAIELLERVKHLFNVPNVIFVLALDKRQMQTSLQAVYGHGINSAEYLRRFIDLEFTLPVPEPAAFTRHLMDQFEFNTFFRTRTRAEFRYDSEHFVESINLFSELFELSLRAREQICTRLRLAMNSTGIDYFFYPVLLTGLIILREIAPEVYRSYVSHIGSASVVTTYLRKLDGGDDFLDSDAGILFEAYLIAVKSHHVQMPAEYDTYVLEKDKNSLPEPRRERANRIVEIVHDIKRRERFPNIEYVTSKIELMSGLTQ